MSGYLFDHLVGTAERWERNGNDWNNGFPLLVHALLRLKCRSCVIDAEVVAHNEKGVPDFRALRRREPPSLYAFDLLQINGIELRQKPVEFRREALRDLISGHGPAILYSEEIDAPADLAFKHVCKLGLEGIVSKRRGMAYESGRSQRWLKTINPNAPARQRLLDEDWNDGGRKRT